jgi:anti-sigma factor ChrR (cupin superfamily)
MPRFAKQPDCPTSVALATYGAGTLSFLARPVVAAHVAACEFCGAELSLHARHGAPAVETTTPPQEIAPAMPLALRLFARSALADLAADVRVEARCAA